jgi:hypothetical protein
LLTLLPASTEAAVATQRQLARGSDPQTEAGARTAATLGCQVLDSCVCGSPACVDAVLCYRALSQQGRRCLIRRHT